MPDKSDSKPAANPVAAKPVTKPPTPATKAAAAAAKPAAVAKPAVAKPAAAKPAAAKPATKPTAAAKTSAVKKPAANPQKDALVAAVKKTEAVKPAAKTAAKPAAKPVAKPVKVEKPKKPKLVRDSFTIPEGEYAQLATLKKRLLALGIAAKKGEIMRAGLALLAAQKDAELGAELKKLTLLKTGRPAK